MLSHMTSAVTGQINLKSMDFHHSNMAITRAILWLAVDSSKNGYHSIECFACMLASSVFLSKVRNHSLEKTYPMLANHC